MTYMAGGKQYVAIPVGFGFSLVGNRVVKTVTPEIPVPSQDLVLMAFALPDGGSR